MSESPTAFIAQLPLEQQMLTQFLHEFLLREFPELRAKIKWQIPFYTRHHNLCYLNPKPEKLILGFVYGAFLPNQSGALVGEGKQVRHLELEWKEELSIPLLRELLEEAIQYDEILKKK